MQILTLGTDGRLTERGLDGIYGTSDTQTYDDLRMPGTRCFSIWNATTGVLVSDTASLETLLLLLARRREG